MNTSRFSFEHTKSFRLTHRSRDAVFQIWGQLLTLEKEHTAYAEFDQSAIFLRLVLHTALHSDYFGDAWDSLGVVFWYTSETEKQSDCSTLLQVSLKTKIKRQAG